MANSTGRIKIFFLKLLILTCVIIFADVVGGLILNGLFYKQKSGKYFTTSHALKNCKEEIIIFGNSHAAQHFDAPLMQKKLAKTVFNFGNQGQSLFYVSTLVKIILSYHKPELIIINIDYNELRYELTDYQKLSILLPYYHTNPIIDSAIAMMPDHELLKARSALYRYNSTIGYLLFNTYNQSYNKSLESLGYDPMIGNMCSSGSNDLEDGSKSDKIIFDSIKINCLTKLINIIKTNRIKLLVTTTPLFNYDSAKRDLYREKLQKILNKMNVDYLDYGSNADFKGKCELFHDGSHLDPAGADEWTNKCIEHIKKATL